MEDDFVPTLHALDHACAERYLRLLQDKADRRDLMALRDEMLSLIMTQRAAPLTVSGTSSSHTPALGSTLAWRNPLFAADELTPLSPEKNDSPATEAMGAVPTLDPALSSPDPSEGLREEVSQIRETTRGIADVVNDLIDALVLVRELQTASSTQVDRLTDTESAHILDRLTALESDADRLTEIATAHDFTLTDLIHATDAIHVRLERPSAPAPPASLEPRMDAIPFIRSVLNNLTGVLETYVHQTLALRDAVGALDHRLDALDLQQRLALDVLDLPLHPAGSDASDSAIPPLVSRTPSPTSLVSLPRSLSASPRCLPSPPVPAARNLLPAFRAVPSCPPDSFDPGSPSAGTHTLHLRLLRADLVPLARPATAPAALCPSGRLHDGALGSAARQAIAFLPVQYAMHRSDNWPSFPPDFYAALLPNEEARAANKEEVRVATGTGIGPKDAGGAGGVGGVRTSSTLDDAVSRDSDDSQQGSSINSFSRPASDETDPRRLSEIRHRTPSPRVSNERLGGRGASPPQFQPLFSPPDEPSFPGAWIPPPSTVVVPWRVHGPRPTASAPPDPSWTGTGPSFPARAASPFEPPPSTPPLRRWTDSGGSFARKDPSRWPRARSESSWATPRDLFRVSDAVRDEGAVNDDFSGPSNGDDAAPPSPSGPLSPPAWTRADPARAPLESPAPPSLSSFRLGSSALVASCSSPEGGIGSRAPSAGSATDEDHADPRGPARPTAAAAAGPGLDPAAGQSMREPSRTGPGPRSDAGLSWPPTLFAFLSGVVVGALPRAWQSAPVDPPRPDYSEAASRSPTPDLTRFL